jgi:hypothetical protein
MHERCPLCGLRYEREPGYFMGAMYISYALTLPPGVLLYLAIWYFSGWSHYKVLLATAVAFLPLVPPVVRLARVLWIYLDRGVDPE